VEEIAMSKFEELIRVAITAAGRTQGRPSGPFEHGFTVGDFNRAVKSVVTRKDAILFYKGYVEYLKSLPANDKHLKGKTEEQVARTNIGWMFWDGMTLDAIKMWNESTGATNPIFGSTVPTVREAFVTGRKYEVDLIRRRKVSEKK
jgi:hypothetical protein